MPKMKTSQTSPRKNESSGSNPDGQHSSGNTQKNPDSVDNSSSSQEQKAKYRAVLIGSSHAFPTTDDITSPCCTFGKSETCDITFRRSSSTDSLCTRYWDSYSKHHFKIISKVVAGDTCYFLEDTSLNGTYLNGLKVGRGLRSKLTDRAVISLCCAKNKAYDFFLTSSKSTGCENIPAYSLPNLPKAIDDKYILCTPLGEGATGKVYSVLRRNGKESKYALKIIPKRLTHDNSQVWVDNERVANREIRALQNASHPCIVRIFEVFDLEQSLYLVIELVGGGELFTRITQAGKMNESVCRVVIYQLAHAVNYLHEKGLTHRDIKPENILLSSCEEYPKIKLTDFGTCKYYRNAGLQTFCGTTAYLAPELFLDEQPYTPAVDNWATGVVLFICLSGYHPFFNQPGMTDDQVVSRIKKAQFSLTSGAWTQVSPEAKDLVYKLIVVDVSSRLTCKEVMKHPWFLNNPGDVEQALKIMGRSDSYEFPEIPVQDVAGPVSQDSLKRHQSMDSCSTDSGSKKMCLE